MKIRFVKNKTVKNFIRSKAHFRFKKKKTALAERQDSLKEKDLPIKQDSLKKRRGYPTGSAKYLEKGRERPAGAAKVLKKEGFPCGREKHPEKESHLPAVLEKNFAAKSGGTRLGDACDQFAARPPGFN